MLAPPTRILSAILSSWSTKIFFPTPRWPNTGCKVNSRQWPGHLLHPPPSSADEAAADSPHASLLLLTLQIKVAKAADHARQLLHLTLHAAQSTAVEQRVRL